MSQAEQAATVKKETMYMVAIVCLVVGFLGGIIFSIYKSPGGAPAPSSAPQQQAQGQLTPDQINTMLSLEREVAANPNNEPAWTQLGHLYFDSNQFQKAINAYNKSLSINPNNANVLTDLGVMYRRSGQPDKAIESFDKAIKVDANHETARFNKGIVLLYDLNDQQGAIQVWQQLVQVNPLASAPNGQLVKDIIEELKQGQSN